jgi:hypothetical protein
MYIPTVYTHFTAVLYAGVVFVRAVLHKNHYCELVPIYVYGTDLAAVAFAQQKECSSELSLLLFLLYAHLVTIRHQQSMLLYVDDCAIALS